jgi:AraC-like DNA-binding protein
MNYLKTTVTNPLLYAEAGRFETKLCWQHIKRTRDDFEIIVCTKGPLYIQINQQCYTVNSGDMLMLPSGCVHFGNQPSENGVAFYWLHFYSQAPCVVLNHPDIEAEMQQLISNPYNLKTKDYIIIPSFMTLTNPEIVITLFNHLLHTAHSEFNSKHASNYLSTSILIELYQQFIASYHNTHCADAINRKMAVLLEWIRNHINENITVNDLAQTFHYNKVYLARIFKQKMGMSLHDYINSLKISLSKQMLLQTDKGIKEIAYSLHFDDEKYYMKLFKKYEQITPTQFRNTYSHTYINNS